MPVPTAWRLIWASPRAGGELVGFLLNKAVLTWSGIWSAETCYAEADFHASTYQWRTFSFSLLLLLSRLCQHQQKKVVWHGRQYGYGISRLGLASVRGCLSIGVPPEESHEPDASASVGHWQACIQYLEEKRWGQHPCRPQCGRQRVARKQDGKRSGDGIAMVASPVSMCCPGLLLRGLWRCPSGFWPLAARKATQEECHDAVIDSPWQSGEDQSHATIHCLTALVRKG